MVSSTDVVKPAGVTTETVALPETDDRNVDVALAEPAVIVTGEVTVPKVVLTVITTAGNPPRSAWVWP